MKVYLVQHAEAKKEEEDPSRPLSEKGLKDIKKVAEYIGKFQIRVDKIIHSGKLRAKQTAEILAHYVKPTEILEDKELEPLSDPKIWRDRLEKMNENVMLVGHMPHLGKLTGLLLYEDENKQVVKFRMGGIVCLERENGNWKVEWMIIPDIIYPL